MSRTLARAVRRAGVGLHRGEHAEVELRPAPWGGGRVFVLGGARVPSTLDRVIDTRLATTLAADGARVTLVEHLNAALYAAGVDHAEIHVHGAEIPVMDGSAAPWCAAIAAAGHAPCAAGAPAPLEVSETVRLGDSTAWIQAEPGDGLHIDVTVDYPHPAIGRQRWSGGLADFETELAWARTFGFLSDAEALRASGLARGASLENTLVYDHDGPMHPARAPDEVVRHKALDLIGDLALSPRPIVGKVTAYRAGHALHVALVSALARTAR